MSHETGRTEKVTVWPGDDLSQMDRQDLEDLGRSLMAELKRLKDVRTLAVRRMELVVAERIRRRAPGDDAVASDPPASSGTAPTSAARRLGVLPARLITTGAPVVPKPPTDATAAEVVVSDHAAVRYMERVLGIDVAAIRRRVLTPSVRAAIAAGLRRIRTSEGVVIYRDGAVTSFLPAPSKKRTKVRTGRKHRNARGPVEPDPED